MAVHTKSLQLLRCTRSNNGNFAEGPVSFLWSICMQSKRPHNVWCLALAGEGKSVTEIKLIKAKLVATRNKSSDAGSNDFEFEYSIDIPNRFHRFIVFSGLKTLLVTGRTTYNMIEEYGHRIANASVDDNYPRWLEHQRALLSDKPAPHTGPLISLITPAYNTPPLLLQKMIGSVLNQTYSNWELIIVNASPQNEEMQAVFHSVRDPRVRIIDTPYNLGITGNTNLGIAHATGNYVSFFDHDDTLEPHALAEMTNAIEEHGGAPGLLYCDEDNIDEYDKPMLPLLKPAYNPDLLLSNNYIIHLLTVRKDILDQIKLSGDDVEGAQDYDLTFKAIELGATVVHVPHVLYHWRIHSGSTAGDPSSKSYAQDAGKRAISQHLARAGINGIVKRGPAYFTYQVDFTLPVIVPSLYLWTRDGISPCTRKAVNRYSAELDANVVHLNSEMPAWNQLRAASSPSLLLFISKEHDVEYSDLIRLVSVACQHETFSVAPRVIRKDGLIDYAGMIVQPNGVLRHLLRYLPEADGGYVGRAQRPYDASVVNPECCIIRIDKLEFIDFHHTQFRTPRYTLAEIMVQAFLRGCRNVFLPYATALLNSDRSLLDDLDAPSPEELEDAAQLIRLHPSIKQGDPSHNQNFDCWDGYYKIGVERIE